MADGQLPGDGSGDGGGCGGAAAIAESPTKARASAVSAVDRKAAAVDLIQRKREALKRQQQEKLAQEQATTERWSGLRIEGRCVRQEKWDNSMRGKNLVPIRRLAELQPKGLDQVVIGVLCVPPSKLQHSPASERQASERFVELTFTDLDRQEPVCATLVLTGRALEHWALPDGDGRRHCTVGSIFGVLNPTPTCRVAGMRVSTETQLLKLGTCPALAFCPARVANGQPCGRPYNAEAGAGYCPHHAGMSHFDREAEVAGRAAGAARQKAAHWPAARPAASPLRACGSGGPTEAHSDGQPAASWAASAAVVMRGVDAGSAELVEALQQLEAASLDAETINQTGIYKQVGKLLGRKDAAGVAAQRLRRVWRGIQGAGVDASKGASGQDAARAAATPPQKRARVV